MKRLPHLQTRWRALSGAQQTLLGLLGWALLIGSWLIWQDQRLPGAALYGHNHTDRPIFSYFVNDHWGGNGGVTCCWRIEGKTLKVEWILDVTPEQIEQGLEEETLSLELPNPPRQRGDDTLHVHFLPSDQVRLAWSNKHTSPLKDELSAFYAKDKEYKTP